MADATTEFFEEIARRGEDPRLIKATGSIRFELADGDKTERWLLSMKKGALTVSHAKGDADCIVRADRTVFNRIVTGESNAMAVALRGRMTAEGDSSLLVQFQRLLPGPPKATAARRAAGYSARKQS